MKSDSNQKDQASMMYDVKGEYIDNEIANLSQEQETDNIFQQSMTIKVEVTDKKLMDANTSRDNVTDNEPRNNFNPDVWFNLPCLTMWILGSPFILLYLPPHLHEVCLKC